MEEETLRKVFNKCQEVVWKVVKSSQDQKTIEETATCLEDVTRTVNRLALFSDNETAQELPTSSLPFLLLPAYLGILKQNWEPTNRMEALDAAEVYFKDFLRRVKSYEAVGEDIAKGITDSDDGPISITPSDHQARRDVKIKRFKSRQVDEQKMKELESRKADGLEFGEDEERDLYFSEIRWWAQTALDELDNIEKEKPMLEHIMKIKAEGNSRPVGPGSSGDSATSSSTTAGVQVPSLKPIILTRSKLQKEVFGAGYPSLPTMTIEEWFEKFGGLHMQATAGTSASTSEAETDKDDDEDIAKARAQDEYKDTHRKGWGNTYNKG